MHEEPFSTLKVQLNMRRRRASGPNLNHVLQSSKGLRFRDIPSPDAVKTGV
jgi:hypothetical protein